MYFFSHFHFQLSTKRELERMTKHICKVPKFLYFCGMDETVTITQNKPTPSFIEDIKELVAQGRRQAYAAVNQAMVSTYWQIGKRIVEEEQQGQTRAEYENNC